MGVKQQIKHVLNSFLMQYDHEIIESSLLYDWQKSSAPFEPSYQKNGLPDGADDYLGLNNPRLSELQEKYANFDTNVTDPLLWTDSHVRPEDLKYFRGDNAYVWQLRGPNMSGPSYALTTYYTKAIDNPGLLERLAEDEHFGIYTFNIDGKVISRDLLDSIIEIYFLEKHLNISNWANLNILDIGAGYGRLAHRMVKSFDNISNFFCTDGVFISTFISEYYLRFRNVHDKAKTIPLYNIENTLKENRVDIAVNIHSFSECQMSAIDWWLGVLERNRVKYLMIVPNAYDGNEGKALLAGEHGNYQDFSEIITGHGYKLIVKEPKYRDPIVQQYGINSTHHYLFELAS